MKYIFVSMLLFIGCSPIIENNFSSSEQQTAHSCIIDFSYDVPKCISPQKVILDMKTCEMIGVMSCSYLSQEPGFNPYIGFYCTESKTPSSFITCLHDKAFITRDSGAQFISY